MTAPPTANDINEETLLSRRQLAHRGQVSESTIKRTEKRLKLKAVRLGARTLRYRLTDILAIEQAG